MQVRLSATSLLLAALTGQAPEPIAIVPQPVRVDRRAGAFMLTASTPIVADTTVRAQARQLATMLGPATGYDLPVRTGAAPRAPHIALRIDRALATALGDEGYRLTVTPRAVTIRAAAPAGIFYGMQTLRQLLPAEMPAHLERLRILDVNFRDGRFIR